MLGMVDDVLGITEAGWQAQEMNAFMDIKSAVKRLQFGGGKCKTMLVGKTSQKYHKNRLFIDSWKVTHEPVILEGGK